MSGAGLSGGYMNHTEAEEGYLQLNALLGAAPDLTALDASKNTPDDTLRWLGEVSATIGRVKGSASVEFNLASRMLLSSVNKQQYAAQLKMILYRTLAQAQQLAPASTQSAFIATGADFDAFVAVQRIFKKASSSILVVDPYMDETALSSFAVLANEGVTIALLTDAKGVRPGLKPAAASWIAQYGDVRKLNIRVAAERSLHDRLILSDSSDAWIITQSLKDFAARSPATIQKVDPQLATMKFEAYSKIWDASEAYMK